jgi:hypothetical protein
MTRLYRFNKMNPVARAVCDRCGFIVAHNTLREQMDFRGGDAPVPTGILVCPKCEDKPQPFYARPLVKNDPVPVENPRPPSA